MMVLSVGRAAVRLIGGAFLVAAAALFPGTASANTEKLVPIRVGNITIFVVSRPVLQTPAQNVYYAYDALGRLIREDYFSSSNIETKQITYSFDGAGNITSNAVTCINGGC